MMADAADAEILRRLLLDLRAAEATLQAMLARGASRIQEMLETDLSRVQRSLDILTRVGTRMGQPEKPLYHRRYALPEIPRLGGGMPPAPHENPRF